MIVHLQHKLSGAGGGKQEEGSKQGEVTSLQA